MSEITHIKDLTHDPKNARRHTPRNVGMLERALNEVGAARSIVVDEDGVVLAGNATIDAAVQAGITRVQVVEADGNTIIAVRRSGLTDEQKVKLALYDNRVAELAEWEPGVLAELADTGALESMFFPDELSGILERTPTDADWMSAFEGGGASGDLNTVNITFVVAKIDEPVIREALATFAKDKNVALVLMAQSCQS